MPQMKQGGIEVNKMVEQPIPATAHHALERSHGIDKEVHSNRMAREEEHSSMQAEQNHVPHNKGLKMANHVKDAY